MPRRVLILISIVLAAGCGEGDAGAGDAHTGVGRDSGRVTLNDDARPPPPPGDGSAARPGDGGLQWWPDGDLTDARPAAEDGGEPADARERPLDAAPIPDGAPDALPEPDAAGGDRCAAALAEARWDFEGGPQGWNHQAMDGQGGGWPFDAWEHGAVAGSGPGACAEGGGCWATNLAGGYVQCQRAELRSPPVDLSACAGRSIALVFDEWHAWWSQDPFYDGGTVELSADGQAWRVLAPGAYPGTVIINPELGFGYTCQAPNAFHVDGLPGFVGISQGWQEATLPLGDEALGQPIFLRFAYASGVSARTIDPDESAALNPDGWYLDNVRFELR